MFRGLRPGVAGLLILLLTSGAGAAEKTEGADASEEEDLPVFVDETAVLEVYRADDEAPVPHTNLTEEEIERKSFGQEPSLMLSETPSMTAFTDSGGTNGYSYFRLRGIDQTRVNMTLDGVPLNEPEDQGVYFSNYPGLLGFVSSVQVRRGAGTTANGVASFAGSILFETPGLARERAVEAGVGYGSFGSERATAQLATPLGRHGSLFARAVNPPRSIFASVRWSS